MNCAKVIFYKNYVTLKNERKTKTVHDNARLYAGRQIYRTT